MKFGSEHEHFCITSTLNGQRILCKPLQGKTLYMYVCGVTPYDNAHIGHGRCYVTFDMVYRILQAQGYTVVYCRNVTDIDDKLLHRAQKELGSAERYIEIAQKYTRHFHADVEALGCLPPTYEPRVTDHIPDIISAIVQLIDSGHAYEVAGSVYFRIHTYPAYGQLSKQRISEMQVGARIENKSEKENPLDFALWKAERNAPFWKSPWGYGRPGWHIECSALALRYLGETVDLHGGGMDLIFPHHENERAQSESITHKEFARMWMHNAFVRVQEEKMSKSLGNFITLREAFERVDPMVLRYYYSTHHYRIPLDFAWEDIQGAEKAYRRLIQLLSAQATPLADSLPVFDELLATPQLSSSARAIVEQVITKLLNDLNAQGAFSILFEHAHTIKGDIVLTTVLKRIIREIVGLSLSPLPEATITITPEIQALLDERSAARLAKDWKRADEIRAQLLEHNVPVQDDKL